MDLTTVPLDPWRLPHIALAFFGLMMAILSLWIKRSAWIWGSFLIFAFSLASFARLITPVCFIPLVSLLVLHGILKGEVTGLLRFVLVIFTMALSLGLYFHLFPGFKSWPIVSGVSLSKNAPPFSLSLSFDKPFMGMFVLTWGFSLISSASLFKALLKKALPLILVGIALFIFIALFFHKVEFDPKMSSLLFLFIPANLLFVCIPQEAFFRGFVQEELYQSLKKTTPQSPLIAKLGSLFFSSLFFAATYYKWAPDLSFLGLIFVAGLIFGALYQYTRSIEASILCHFLFNVTYFFFFTYTSS